MPERRWRVLGRGRGLFAIDVDDGGRFRAATTPEVDAALRQRELFGAAGQRGSGVTRCGTSVPTIATTSASDDDSGEILAHLGERAVQTCGRVASPGPATAVGVVGVPALGLAVRVARGYAACDGGVRWRVYARGLPPSATARSRWSWAAGWPKCSSRIDRADAGAEARGPGVPSAWERPSVAVRPGALDPGIARRTCARRIGAADCRTGRGQVVRYVGADNRDA